VVDSGIDYIPESIAYAVVDAELILCAMANARIGQSSSESIPESTSEILELIRNWRLELSRSY
jgi:hypothetical protein